MEVQLTYMLQYSCFVEGCERKCMTHQKRRMHLIDKHMYPKNFFFAVTRDGIDGRRSLLNDSSSHHRRRSSTNSQATKNSRRRASLKEGETSPSQQEPKSQQEPRSPTAQRVERKEEKVKPDTDMTDLAGAMSSLSFVPPSVRFGRGRAGFAKN